MTEHVRRYELGGLIAKGGMAEIVAASAVSEPGVAKRVALKKIRTDRSADPIFVARFFDEARLAMQLSHANIVQVFDFGRTEEGEFFLAMEFVEGVDLQRLRHTEGCTKLPPAEALHIVAQVCRGLDYAHRRVDSAGQPLGVVHLDVKPANVLLSFEGEVKLTDFGVARSRAARQSEPGITGTIPFMSPEQARGDPVDLRSDVYSSGVLLYALLTGSCPFGEEDTMRTVELLRKGTPAPPAIVPEADAIEPLLRKALSPSLEARFPTAGAFADAIEELMYYRAWRTGAAALGERVRTAFPEERMRLNALFAPGTHVEGLNVQHPATGREGTLLSRIPDVAAPVRQTQVADTIVRPRHRLGAAIFAASGVGALLLAAGGWLLLRTPAPKTPEGWELLDVQLDAGFASAPDAASAGLDASTVPLVEPPPPPRIERPVGMGTLTVNANPWGTVSVNGKSAGTTPLMHFPVRAGTANVVVENPKLGRKTIAVKIMAGKDTPLIVDLRNPDQPK